MEAFFRAASFFANEPGRALAVALVFLALGLSERRMAHRVPDIKTWVQFVPAAAWMLFAMNESYMRAAGANIRIDLFLTWPVMVLLTLIGLAGWSGNVRRWLRAPRHKPPSSGAGAGQPDE